MIRVLIAEDEPPTQRRIKRLIEQTDPDFVVATIVGDGEKALEAMAEVPCDVVFTDIRMPVMDGLRLMDALHARYPDCLVVAVSGHQDFAYVAHAVRAQILDYILKPVSQEDMEALLVRVKEAHGRIQREKLSRHLSAKLNRASVEDYAQPSPAGMRLGVCLFCAGPVPISEEAEMYPGAAAWSTLSPERTLETMRTGKVGFTWEFMGNTPVERIFIFETETAACDAQAQAIHGAMLDNTSFPISCACLWAGVDISETGHAIRRLRRCLQDAVRIGRGIFLAVGGEQTPPIDAPAQEDVALLSGLIREGRLGSGFGDVAQRMMREDWPQQRVYALFSRALAQLTEDAALAPQVRQYREVITELLHTALSWEEVLEGLSGLEPFAAGTALDAEAHSGIAQRVEQYLRAHYSEHINNQTLAAEFGYVPSYVSILFRKVYDVSPAEYLTKVRLEAAKRLMQANPHMLIREVSEAVGFKSQHHFSRIFKKNEGIWPTGYQP